MAITPVTEKWTIYVEKLTDGEQLSVSIEKVRIELAQACRYSNSLA